MVIAKWIVLVILFTLTPTPTSASPTRTRVLYYSPNVMQRVIRNHQKPSRPGDYVATFRLRDDVDGYTAIRYRDRALMALNTVVVARLYDPKLKKWVVQRLQITDWQKKSHASKEQRLEVDYETAKRVHALCCNTIAEILRYER